MAEKDIRKKAAQTAVDGFIVVEKIYRHSHQVMNSLKDDLKAKYNLKVDSPPRTSSQSASDPLSWIYQFRGFYLAYEKFSLDEYKKKVKPILFILASLYNPDGQEPILRYGVIEKIYDMKIWKGATFDDYVRMILARIHDNPKPGHVRASHCEASVLFYEKPLLDIREDKDIELLAIEIGDKYIKLLDNG
ncbi:MAG: hypothetical protein AB2L22_13075 [Syntrophales bacterium]